MKLVAILIAVLTVLAPAAEAAAGPAAAPFDSPPAAARSGRTGEAAPRPRRHPHRKAALLGLAVSLATLAAGVIGYGTCVPSWGSGEPCKGAPFAGAAVAVGAVGATVSLVFVFR